jgi:hypothetical protein
MIEVPRTPDINNGYLEVIGNLETREEIMEVPIVVPAAVVYSFGSFANAITVSGVER